MAEPFADNWSYIKTELTWLDRLLMTAVGRQRREMKETEGFAQNARDRVTRPWWKGIITLDQNPNFDNGRPAAPPKEEPSFSYHQQLSARIEASRSQGIVLGLPTLQQHLQLNLFEKNLVLLCLAPEVNRRYSKLYNYLQEDEHRDGPLVDLALKLFCRNDQEWQIARLRLATACPLVDSGLLQFLGNTQEPLLTHTLKLSDSLTSYLLAGQLQDLPFDWVLQQCTKPLDDSLIPWKHAGKRFPKLDLNPLGLTHSLPYALEQLPKPVSITVNPWQSLVLPDRGLSQLQQMGLQVHQSLQNKTSGEIALSIGSAGTGKTFSAQVLAAVLNLPFYRVNLSQYAPDEFAAILEALLEQSPSLLLLEPAQDWLGKKADLPHPLLQKLLHHRRSQPGLTLFESRFQLAISWRWQSWLDRQILFPKPNAVQRLRLWQQVFSCGAFSGMPSILPPGMVLDAAIDWVQIAKQWRLTGGEIRTVAARSILAAQVANTKILTLAHLRCRVGSFHHF
jgi:hypothetical protein